MKHAIRLVAVLFSGIIPAAAGPLVCWCAGSLERTGRHDAPRPVSGISIEAARNERESFQVITRGSFSACPFRISALVGPAGATLPPPRILQEQYVVISQSSPHAPLPPGEYADVLVPASQGRAAPDNLENVPWWIDIAIPRDAAPGAYQGSVVLEDNRRIPVQVVVRPVTLPDVPLLRSAFGCHWRQIAAMHGLNADSGSPQLRALVNRYHAQLADHCLTPDEPMALSVECDREGNLTRFPEAEIASLFSALHFTMLPLPVYDGWPFADPTGSDRPAARRYLAALMHEMKRRGWEDRVYVSCPVDEPASPETYAQVRAWGSLCREAEAIAGAKLPLLCTVSPQPQSPQSEWGSLSGSVNLWTALFPELWTDLQRAQPATVSRMRAGDEVWAYAALVQYPDTFLKGRGADFRPRDHHPPVWQLDFSPMNYRIAPWLCAANGWTGLLYWDTLHWDGTTLPQASQFRLGQDVFNGDGQLLYSSAQGPLASLRLKWLRDGMEDYALFHLAQRNNAAAALDAVRFAAPAVDGWSDSPAVIAEARRRLFEIAAAGVEKAVNEGEVSGSKVIRGKK